MLSSKYKYSTHNFIICLKSIKIHQEINTLKYIPNLHQFLIVIYTILKIRTQSIQKKLRLHYIITNYSFYAQRKHNLLIYKYVQKFTHEYKKYMLVLHVNKKRKNIIYTMACTYIYILYKLLKSKNPLFIYYFLIKNNQKA